MNERIADLYSWSVLAFRIPPASFCCSLLSIDLRGALNIVLITALIDDLSLLTSWNFLPYSVGRHTSTRSMKENLEGSGSYRPPTFQEFIEVNPHSLDLDALSHYFKGAVMRAGLCVDALEVSLTDYSDTVPISFSEIDELRSNLAVSLEIFKYTIDQMKSLLESGKNT